VKKRDRDKVVLKNEKTFYYGTNFECHMTFNFGTDGVSLIFLPTFLGLTPTVPEYECKNSRTCTDMRLEKRVREFASPARP
jgi:hypothetical protein